MESLHYTSKRRRQPRVGHPALHKARKLDWFRHAGLQSGLALLCLWLVSLQAQAEQTIALAWDPNPESNIAGYKFYYGTTSRIYPNVLDVGNRTIGSASNLVEGITYYFAITAYNTLGVESDFSEEIPYTVPYSDNLPPTLDMLPDLTVAENAGIQIVQLSGITPGGLTEIQPLTVRATSSDPEIIPHPSVTYATPSIIGSLRFAPLATTSGSATITVSVDDGRAQTSRSFVVTVNPANRRFNVKSLVPSVSNGWIVNWESIPGRTYRVLSKTRLNQPRWVYCSDRITAVSTNTSWVHLSTVHRLSRFYMVEFIEDLPPTLNSLKNLTLFTNAGIQTIQLSGISSGSSNENQILTITATSSNPTLIPNPDISYFSPNSTGILQFTPAPNRSGSATITVTLNDGKAQTACSFVVMINPTGDLFRINSLTRAPGGGWTVNWYGRPGLIYRVLSKASPAQSNWTDRTGNITATSTNMSWTDSTPPHGNSPLYLIQMVIPE
jgi:hypothetical protein